MSCLFLINNFDIRSVLLTHISPACIFFFIGSLAAIVSNRYSYKTAVLLGVAFRASGYILSSFAPSITYLYLTLGVITGISNLLFILIIKITQLY